MIKGAIESGDFNAMKFQKKKNLDVNEWYKLLQISIKSLEKYVLEGYPMGISFGGSNDNWDLILEGKSASTSEAAKPEAAKRNAYPMKLLRHQKFPFRSKRLKRKKWWDLH